MAVKLEQLKSVLLPALGGKIVSLTEALGELTLVVDAKDYAATARWLRDDPALRFEELIDLCGVDYSRFGEVSSGFEEDNCESCRFRTALNLLCWQRTRRPPLRRCAPSATFTCR